MNNSRYPVYHAGYRVTNEMKSFVIYDFFDRCFFILMIRLIS